MAKKQYQAQDMPADQPSEDPRVADQPMVPAVIDDSPALAPQNGQPRVTWFSWPVSVGEGEFLNASVRLGADRRLLDMIGQRITVNRVMSYREDIPDQETGEVRRLTAIVLLSPDGESYKCHSVGIAGAVRELLTAIPSAPWTPPLILEVCEKQTRSNRRMLWLKLVGIGSTDAAKE